MIYNGHTDGQDIFSFARLKADMDADALPNQDIALHGDPCTTKVWQTIHNAVSGWKYVDNNDSSDPKIYTAQALVADQPNYLIPAQAAVITGVAVKDEAGNTYLLDPITEENINERSNMQDYSTTSGRPTQYRLEGDEIVLEPAPNYGQAAALITYFDPRRIKFAHDATTDSPGWDEMYHHGLSSGIAMYATKGRKKQRHKDLKDEWKEFLVDLTDFYKNRFAAFKPRKIRNGNNSQGGGYYNEMM